MKRITIGMIMAASILLGSCSSESQKANKADNAPLIERPTPTISDGRLTPEVLYSLARISDAKLSPDGTRVLYGSSFFSVEQNKGNRELFVVNIDGTDKQQITRTPQSESNAVWFNEGKEIAFLSSESGSPQIWLMNPDGSNRRRISNFEGGVNGFAFSPDETQILFFSDIPVAGLTKDIYPDLPQATGRIVKDLMYKHWDEWVETIPHPFLASFDGKMMGEAKDILEGEPYECPMKPSGGIGDFSWSPNGEQIAYTCRKKTGLEYSLSTNSDIYLYDIASGTSKNLTEGMMGYDTAPQYSPDGQSLAWISQERDGYESDKHRLFVMNLASGEKTYMTEDFDYNVDLFQWAEDGQSFYFIACKEALTHLWQMDLNKDIRQITTGQYDYVDMDLVAGNLIGTRQSLVEPSEILHINIENGEATEISFENKDILAQLNKPTVEPRWIKTTDGKEMLTWVVLPPNFDASKKYPAILYCQGGPQNTVSQFWSYRWNPCIMSHNDYIIVMPNRRGLPGFGQEWLEQISGDYGGQNMKDYFSAIDAVAKESYVDEARLGAVGASYGGFSVYWLAGHHQKRFKALIAHAGIFNLEQQYLETEEMWFANWDMGGAYWDKSNAIAQRTFANSPHLFVDKWDTPILVTHGELDFRILASQGMSAFNAAKLRGVPAEMLIFPDENHWIMQPQNGVLFQRVFFSWLDQWLKEK